MAPEPGSFSPRRTKLRPPRLAGDVVVRPRLLARLNQAAAMSLVIAPAGYGKTTLVSTWLTQVDVPSVWMSLDDDDNDPHTFLAGLVAAIGNVFPAFGGSILGILNSPHGRAFSDLIPLLLNALDEVEGEFILVLDDYHVISDPAIHQLLIALVTYPPHTMQLVITARHDPPLPWHVRTRSALCELRAADLSFTEVEAAQFLHKACNRPIADGDVRTLLEESQGWITSLRLAALLARQHPADAILPDLLASKRRNLVDYFSSELLAQLAPEVFTFLTRTAILDILSGPLCDFVVNDAAPEGRGTALLHGLEVAGAFTVALDDEGTWYRYHPLLRQVLLHQLGERASNAEVAGLYERACEWHEQQALLDEALGYALASGKTAIAVDLVRRHRHKFLDNLEMHLLDRWLRQFPPGAVAESVDLLLTRAWIHQLRFSLSDISRDLDRAEALVAAMPPEAAAVRKLWGEIAALRSHQHLADGDAAGAIAAAQRGLYDTPPNRFYIRAFALLNLALGYQMAGDLPRAYSLLDATAEEPWISRDLAIMRTIQLRSYVNLAAANLGEVLATVPNLLSIASARAIKTSVAWAHYFLGCASYLQNELGRALENFSAVIDLADFAHTRAYTHSAIGLALTHQALGRPHAAVAAVTAAREFLAGMHFNHALPLIDAFAAELGARQGRVEEAVRWAARENRYLAEDATPLFYAPGLAIVRIYLVAGATDRLDEAQATLQRQKDRALRTHNVHLQIQSFALEAALHCVQGNPQQAVAALSYALALAEGGQVMRVFVDLAPHLAPICTELAAYTGLSGFAAQACTAIEIELEHQVRAVGGPAAELPATDGAALAQEIPQNNLVSPEATSAPGDESDLRQVLTYREMDVLNLLNLRLTNKEIARALGISAETVRQHTVNLFRKLHVDNRRQAVVAAHSMGYFNGHS